MFNIHTDKINDLERAVGRLRNRLGNINMAYIIKKGLTIIHFEYGTAGRLKYDQSSLEVHSSSGSVAGEEEGDERSVSVGLS